MFCLIFLYFSFYCFLIAFFPFILLLIPYFFISLLLFVSLPCPSTFIPSFQLSLIYSYLPIFLLFIAVFVNSVQSKYPSYECKTYRTPFSMTTKLLSPRTCQEILKTRHDTEAFILNCVCFSHTQTRTVQ